MFPSSSQFLIRVPSLQLPIGASAEEQIHALLSGRTVASGQLPSASFTEHTSTRRMKLNHETVPYPLAWSLVTSNTTNQTQYSSSAQLQTQTDRMLMLDTYQY